jgi:hypothetical protein
MVGLLALTGIPKGHVEAGVDSNNVPLKSSVRLGPFIDIWLDNDENYLPTIAYNSHHDEYLVVWYNDLGPTKDIIARRVRSDGTLLNSFTIAHNENSRYYDPDLAYSPLHDEYLVAWSADSVSTDRDIWARRVKWDGSWMSAEIAIGRPDKTGKQTDPAVAYNTQSDEYLVVYENRWTETWDIDAQRVRASDGAALSWRNIATGTGEKRSFPDVAYSPSDNHYLIAYWYRPSSSPELGDILGKVTSANMSTLSAEIDICADGDNQRFVTLASSAEGFLAAWEESAGTSPAGIFARRITSDGTPIGPPGGFVLAGGSPVTGEQSPFVVSGGASGFMVIWHRYTVGADHDLIARLVKKGSDSALNSEFAISTGSGNQWAPAAACSTSGDCLVVYQDNNSSGGDFEIRGRMVIFDRIYLPISIKME